MKGELRADPGSDGEFDSFEIRTTEPPPGGYGGPYSGLEKDSQVDVYGKDGAGGRNWVSGWTLVAIVGVVVGSGLL